MRGILKIRLLLHVRCCGRINWVEVKSVSKTNCNSKFLCSEKYASLKTDRVIFSLMKNWKRAPSCLTSILEQFSLTAQSKWSLNTFCWWCQNYSSWIVRGVFSRELHLYNICEGQSIQMFPEKDNNHTQRKVECKRKGNRRTNRIKSGSLNKHWHVSIVMSTLMKDVLSINPFCTSCQLK